MYRLNPNNKYQIPSSNLAGLFKPQENLKFDQIPNNIEVIGKQATTKPAETKESDEFEMRAEFEKIVKQKLEKIDEVLDALKARHDKIYEEQAIVQETLSSPLINNSLSNQPQQKITNATLLKSQTPRTKKTYYQIIESMWTDVKSKFPDLSDELKSKIYSDGTDYYVDMKNKKCLLDNKLLLKILSKKS